MKKLFSALVLIFFASFVYAEDALPPPSETSEPSVASGMNKISLDIKGMDVVDVLKIISTRSGMNIVVGKNVVGRVTLFLKDVDINDVFEIVILSNDLAYDKKGQITNVMTQRDYELLYGESFQSRRRAKIINLRYAKAVDLIPALAQLKSDLGKVVADQGSNTVVLIDGPEKIRAMEEFIKSTDQPLETKVFNLNYATADKLNSKLQEVITKNVGSIKFDERTNKIVITDYPRKLIEVGDIIKAFDEKTPQVLIDAQIIQITPSDQFQMGVDWNFLIEKYFDVKMGLPINSAQALIMGTGDITPTEKGQFRTIVDVLRTIGDTKILSSPRVMALNNQEAKILVGDKKSYGTSTVSQGGSGNTVTAVDIKEIESGIKLSVTPSISRDGFIMMKIKPEISETTIGTIKVAGEDTAAPTTTTTETETTVIVKDGVTVIMAGMRKDKRTKTTKGIPMLAQIPLVGYIFRSTDDKLEKTDLVILLTPHIMSGETSFSSFSQVKPKEGAVAEMVKGEVVINRVSSGQEEAAMVPSSSAGSLLSEYSLVLIEKINHFSKLNMPKEGKGAITLSFTVSRDGYLEGEPKPVDKWDPLLVPYAVKAIKDAAPFPPLPNSIDKPRETFRISLSYQ